MAPAAVVRFTIKASTVGTMSRKSGEPYVVRIPAVLNKSLCATGRPCSTPSGRRRACHSSAFFASASARSATSMTMAFFFGLTRSRRAMCAAITSCAESCATNTRGKVDDGTVADFVGSDSRCFSHGIVVKCSGWRCRSCRKRQHAGHRRQTHHRSERMASYSIVRHVAHRESPL